MKSYPVLSHVIYIADSWYDKTRGVIGREALLHEGVFIIPHCNWVHTFLMTGTIGVLFMDSSGNIVSTIVPLVPNRLSPWVQKASWVVEYSPTISKEILHELIQNYWHSFR